MEDHGASNHSWGGSEFFAGRREGDLCVERGWHQPGGEPVSPTTVRPGYDGEGNLPSGEVSSVGEAGAPKGVGGDFGPAKNKEKTAKVSNSYPPIFRAKPNESFQDWKRAVSFWLSGEGHQLPPEFIGPRIMAQLRDLAGELVKHLNVEDVHCVLACLLIGAPCCLLGCLKS